MKQPLLSQALGSTSTPSAARPKIMRRPPQFSHGSTEIITSDIALSAQAPITPDTPASKVTATRPWQEDGRFAITLLAIIVTINLILSGWLAPKAPSSDTQSAVTTTPAIPTNTVVILNELNPPESNQ